MRLSRWAASILSSSPVRLSISRLDMWVMELSRAAVAARSCMGRSTFRMERLLRNRLETRDSP